MQDSVVLKGKKECAVHLELLASGREAAEIASLRSGHFYTLRHKDYPTTGSPFFDTVSIKRITANTLEYVRKKDGKEMAKWQYELSGDGKIATVTTKTTSRDRTGAKSWSLRSSRNVPAYHHTPK
jgi:hypothetical protein